MDWKSFHDWQELSVEKRCQHKYWKARLSGYEDAAKIFQQEHENSPEFKKFLRIVKDFIVDNNAYAQEMGLLAALAYVKNSSYATETVYDVMGGIVNKCFLSTRAKTRELALHIVLEYIEIDEHTVLDVLIDGLRNKSPKIVAACVNALRESLHLFGPKLINIKTFLHALPKLLEDRTYTVREESKLLCVEIYYWVGPHWKYIVQLESVNPIILKELDKRFQKTCYLKPTKDNITAIENAVNRHVLDTASQKIDPYDLMKTVNVLFILPENFNKLCKDKKWKKRKEVLETLFQLTKCVKLENGDYTDLVMMLQNLISKDCNVLVVSLACRCLTNLVLGLRKEFKVYNSVCIPAIFEKFKENNHRVVVSLREAIDAIYGISSLESMLKPVQAALNHKNPQVKAETCAFLTRCFCHSSSTQLNKKILAYYLQKYLSASLLKNLNDSDVDVRKSSAEALGTALKVVGERVMSHFLRKVHATQMAKVKYFCNEAGVISKRQHYHPLKK